MYRILENGCISFVEKIKIKIFHRKTYSNVYLINNLKSFSQNEIFLNIQLGVYPGKIWGLFTVPLQKYNSENEPLYENKNH